MTSTPRPRRTVGVPVKRALGALPAVALIGSGIGLGLTGGHPETQVVTDSTPLVTVPDQPLRELEPLELPPLPELPAPQEQAPTDLSAPGGVPATLTVSGIPEQALAAYRRAAAIVNAADPACRIDWALVAAIGKVESNHGRYGGNGIDTDGTVRPGIYGIPLDGSNGTTTIRDTDSGALDRDATWDRAVGPMQFIPGTWRTVGVDANGDGVKDPQNLGDAATAAAVYLCSGPGDLSTPSGARAAVLRYNHSEAYADQVLAIAAGYRGGYTVVPDEGLTDAQRTGPAYLPSGEPQTMASYDPAVANRPAPKPSKTSSSKGSKPAATPGSGASAAPSRPSTTASPGGDLLSGVTDTVGGVVGGVGTVVGGLTGRSTSTSTPTPTPTTTTTTSAPALPLQVLPVGGKCPDGYDPVLSALGITVLCVLHQG